MLIVGIADRPKAESFAVVPFIVRADDGRLLVAGHSETEIDEERLQWLFRNPIGAHDVSDAGARLDAFDRGLAAAWIGGVFAAYCRSLGAPMPDIPDGCHALKGLGRFWTGPRAELEAGRARWIEAAARLAVRARDRALADLLVWADPWSPERMAAVWYTRDTEEERGRELQWFSQIVPSLAHRRRTKAELEAEILRTVERLKA